MRVARWGIVALVLALSSLAAAPAWAACSTDAQCGVDRVCVEGNCYAPISYGGTNYRVGVDFVTWATARARCQSFGWDLAVFGGMSPAVAAVEATNVDPLVGSTGSPALYWIGLHDQVTEGQFRWVNGEAVSFTNWASGEPNNGAGSQDCVAINHIGMNGQWTDEDCSLAGRYVCEPPRACECAEAGECCDGCWAVTNATACGAGEGTCSAGSCICNQPSSCHTTTYDAASQSCSVARKAIGATCDDGNLCTNSDQCEAGQSTPLAGGTNATCGVRANGSLSCWGSMATPPSGNFTDVSVGFNHACALAVNGSIDCWGNNDFNQAVDPAGTFIAVAAGSTANCAIRADRTLYCWGNTAPPPAGEFRAVAAGLNYRCAISTFGWPTCWGQNDHGQSTPPSSSTYTAIAVRAYHSCGVRPEGSIECWGNNDWNQSGLTVGPFTAVSVGEYHTCGLKTNGDILCWGRNLEQQSGLRTGPFIAVTAGAYYSCGIKSDGAVECWGANTNGQAVNQAGPFGPAVPLPSVCVGTDIECTAQSQCHTAGTCVPATGACTNPEKAPGTPCNDGNACTDDACQSGQCVGTTDDTNSCNDGNECTTDVCVNGTCVGTPMADGVACSSDGNACTDNLCVAGQCSHMPVSDGTPCLGDNSLCTTHDCRAGTCTLLSTISCPAPDDCHFAGTCNSSTGLCAASTIRANATACDDGDACTSGESCAMGMCGISAASFSGLSASAQHACVLRPDGHVYCWGNNASGQAGGTMAGPYTQVATGLAHTCALRSDGDIDCWGANTTGQAPARVTGPFTAVSASWGGAIFLGQHTCAIKADDSIQCWGSNTDGQAPSSVIGAFKAVTVGDRHTCAIKADDSIQCWGNNNNGEAPSSVAGAFKAIHTAESHTCAIRSDNAIQCFGFNNSGQAPSFVPGSFKRVAVGNSHSCAIKSDNSVQCWGANNFGQAPTSVTGSFAEVAGSQAVTCFVTTAGLVECIGSTTAVSATGLVPFDGSGQSTTCTALDSCHQVGICDSATGLCSHPNMPNGTPCDDGNACTQTDTCQDGECVGVNPIVCVAPDQCYLPGTCDPSSGECVNAAFAPHGTPCEDGDLCTLADQCIEGTCASGSAVVCEAASQCHFAGTCNPATGLCSNPPRENGVLCDDGDVGTTGDACRLSAGIVEVDARINHSCARRADGTAVCWGANESGQTGNTPSSVVFREIESGGTFACGLRALDNKVQCWGSNANNRATPPDVAFATFALGADFGCGLRLSDSNLQCWGNNAFAQATPSTGAFVIFDLGPTHGCAIRADGSVACWGDNRSGQLNIPGGSQRYKGTCGGNGFSCALAPLGNPVCWGGNSTVVGNTPSSQSFDSLGCGTDHVCGVKADGSAQCWGFNASQQTNVPAGISFRRITGGASYSCGLRADNGAVQCWGAGTGVAVPTWTFDGECHGTPVCTSPDACRVASLHDQGCVLTGHTNGTACNDGNACTQTDICQNSVCTGGNPVTCAASNGCRIAGTCNPDTGTCSPETNKADGTACTDGDACTQTDSCQDGACMGTNPVICTALSQCHDVGTCDPATGVCSNPAKTTGTACDDGNAETNSDYCREGQGVMEVDARGDHSCMRRRTGLVSCWGANGSGQTSGVPSSVVFREVETGGTFACGIRQSDNKIQCWGSNSNNQATPPDVAFATFGLGDNFGCGIRLSDSGIQCWGSNASLQVSTAPVGAFVALGTGGAHACAVATDGTMTCWGSNSAGQRVVPSGDPRFSAVCGGTSFTCGLRTQGSLLCWGNNGSGQTNAPTGTTYTRIACGGGHACAIKQDGIAVCWGANGSGQSNVSGSITWVSIQAGTSHSCGVRATDGGVTCWGSNNSGQRTPPTITTAVECAGFITCDDGNPCTADTVQDHGCVYTAHPASVACNDGNACTQADICQNGICVGTNPVVCTASEACRTAGSCNSATGQCSAETIAANGTPCDDGNACTQTDTCQDGVCVGANPVVCTALNDCHNAGTCDPATGTCSNPTKADGAACTSDGNPCTLDVCAQGQCTHSPTEGACDDGLSCTTGDACVDGACTASPAANTCYIEGACRTNLQRKGGSANGTGDYCLRCVPGASFTAWTPDSGRRCLSHATAPMHCSAVGECTARFTTTATLAIDTSKVIQLRWQRNPPAVPANCTGTSGSACTWVEAAAYCDGLEQDGISHWRLPTVDELRSLIHGCPATAEGGICAVREGSRTTDYTAGTCGGCTNNGGPDGNRYLPEGLFSNIHTHYGIWSSSIPANDTAQAFRIWPYIAAVSFGPKTARSSVICVAEPEWTLSTSWLRDGVNGTTWQNNPPATPPGCTGTNPAIPCTHAEAEAYCDGLVLNGWDDWGLPTIDQLRSLAQGCAASEPGGSCTATGTYVHPVSGCTTCSWAQGPGAAGWYLRPNTLSVTHQSLWSRSSPEARPDLAARYWPPSGLISVSARNTTTYGGVVCVRGAAAFRFQSGAATVLDTTTGLRWAKAPPTLPSGCTVGGSLPCTHAEAAAYCAGLSLDGHTGFRLPTVAEIRGLIEGCPSTATGGACTMAESTATTAVANCGGCANLTSRYLPGGVFSLGLWSGLWTSASPSNNATLAARFWPYIGALSHGPKTAGAGALCVK